MHNVLGFTRTRRYGAPMAVLTLICFLASLLPPRSARADTASATATLADGVGGPASLSAPLPTANSPSASAAVDLPTGALTSAFPFQLQTARGEAQPSLGLSYSSGNGVGFAGVGWSLNIPSIVRLPTHGLPTFDDRPSEIPAALLSDDDFAINGQRLIFICEVVSGGVCGGSQPGETIPSSMTNTDYYRTEIDDGSRYFFNGTTWRVQTKSGHLLQFGTPLDSAFGPGVDKLTAPGPVPGSATSPIFRWDLVRDTDASNNTVYYVYDDQSSLLGTSPVDHPLLDYLTDIYDTPPATATNLNASAFEHHVHLTWELPVPEANVGPLLDPVWRAAPYARLRRVDVTSYGSTSTTQRELVRSYIMSYIWNDELTRYFLKTIETHGTCGKTNGIDNPISEPTAYTAACPILTSATYSYSQIAGASSPVLPTIKSSTSVGSPSPVSGPLLGSENIPYDYMDVDGDGVSDFVEPSFINPNLSSYDSFFVTLSRSGNGGSYMQFSPQNPAGLMAKVSDLMPGAPQVVYGDWLGNGTLSWLWMNINSGTQRASPEVYSTGTGALVGKTLPSFAAPTGFSAGRAADVDGDGLPDMTLVAAPNGSANFTTTLSVRDRTGTTYPFAGPTIETCVTSDMDPKTYGTDSFRTMADMDGDGLPDLLVLSPDSTGKSIKFHIFTNRGNGLFGRSPRSVDHSIWRSQWRQCRGLCAPESTRTIRLPAFWVFYFKPRLVLPSAERDGLGCAVGRPAQNDPIRCGLG